MQQDVRKDQGSPYNEASRGSFPTEKEIFDQIIDSSRSMISIINRDYVYERVNETFCREHKIFSDSVVGKFMF